MPRLLAALMLVLFASLNAMDGVCCPDGCTDARRPPSQQHRSESPDGVCMLCLGGVDSSVRQDLSPCAVGAHDIGLPSAHHVDALSEPVEHPPRS